MHRLLKKEQVLTVPNLLSLVRLALLPVVVWLYTYKENYIGAIGVLVLSGLTDIVDGFVARKFNMVSDLGKILDPVADKLTQITMLACLADAHPQMLILILVFVVKELSLIVLGYLAIKRKDSVNSAKWYGKLNTVIIYSMIVVLILVPDMPTAVVMGMLAVSLAMMIASFVLYAIMYRNILKD